MGPEVGPAFQRRSRDTPSSNIGVRLAETVSRHRPVGGNEVQELFKSYFVTESRSAAYDVGGDPGGEGGL
eukprot:gene20173-biopygen20581